ncbi:biotin--[acetyl-CoA-carboxylase] ligase [Serratia sp. M24T3]|uniref:biotin--[acetyl-CoA-carboxylase] ligase n=1 Tax=Serratia sp. M24T3 TaxID=932213 RepID=UPI00025B8E06|nr:biotin--[acetyl-CoA-carboxylase] ligase [Serratia sp. M24T3]EIC86388.1 biotin-(acetyl-CoA carboxylase) ligase [Serratia sp. M24T3]
MEITFYKEIDSTNSEAKRLVDAGKAPGFAIAAERQTAGRGRFDRVWQTPAGNLALTFAIPAPLSRADLPTLALMTGLALHDILQSLMQDSAKVQIKWPNDMLVNGHKVSGTLIELVGKVLYIGIGVNLVSRPENVPYETFSLADKVKISLEELAQALTQCWNMHLNQWLEFGFTPICEQYNAHLYGRNAPLRISLDRDRTEWASGICTGVTREGHICLRDQNGKITSYNAGDIDIIRRL